MKSAVSDGIAQQDKSSLPIHLWMAGVRRGLAAGLRGERLLVALLLLGLVHGLIYVFLVPPWQHYDEFNHFQYVWLVAHQPGLPKPGDDNPQMDRWVLESMAAHGFYRLLGGAPDLSDPSKPVTLGGYTQLFDPPLYYWLAALPARLIPPDQVDAQLYAGRMVSLVLFLVTLLAAWGTVRELVGADDNPLRWMVPLSIALLPGIVDLMTSLNSNVGAVAFFSLFLWASTRLLKRGISVGDFAWALAAMVACVYTNDIVYIALPLFPIVLFFSLLRGRLRWFAWGLTGAVVVGALAISLTWGDAALWYRSSLQPDATRAVNPQAVLGTHVLQLDGKVPPAPNWLVPIYQHVPLDDVSRLQGKRVTLGVWMWASRPVQSRTPVVHNGPREFSKPVELTTTPSFHAVSGKISVKFNRIWVTISAYLPKGAAPVTIYYDGFVLASGARPLDNPPQFSDSSGEQGQWGGQPFDNVLRNPSVEQASFRFRPWVDRLGFGYLPDNTLPSLVLASLMDPAGTGWIYYTGATRLFRTFWGLFGWGGIPLLGHKPYRWLLIPTLLGIFGLGLAAFRWRRKIPWDFVFIFSLVLLGAWGISLLRSSIYSAVNHVYLPVARYAQPAIIVTMLALNLGWLSFFSWRPVKSSLDFIYRLVKPGSEGVAHFWGMLLYLGLFLWLDVFAVLSIWVYFH